MDEKRAEEITQFELSRIRDMYEKGVAARCPSATVWCRKDPKIQHAARIERPNFDSSAEINEANPCVVMAVMLDMNDEQTRMAVKDIAWQGDGFACAVTLEVWYVSLEKDAPPDVIARVKEAGQKRELHLLEPGLRRERVQVFVETEATPIRMFRAEITREDPADENSPATLGPWEEQELKLPRPDFKRYLPEMRDGRRTLVLPFSGLGQSLCISESRSVE